MMTSLSLCRFVVVVALLLVGGEVAGLRRCEGREASRIEWDARSLRLIEAGANYGRIVRHRDGDLLACYDRAGQIWVEASRDEGKTWDAAPRRVPRPAVGEVTNAELLAMRNGAVLCFFNHRPGDGQHPYAIFASRSVDGGASWSESERLFAARASWEEGCWEPSAIERPDGEIQLFFANEEPYPRTNEQQIAMLRSRDGGRVWEGPRAVSFRAGHRDGMPVPCLLDDGTTAIAIEDNGVQGPLMKPVIVVSPQFGDELGPIGGDSPRRWGALRRPLGERESGAAPYLRRMPTGETILSVMIASPSRPAPRMVVFIGDRHGRDFDHPSEPFAVAEGASGLWNSLFVKSADTITAVSTTTIDGVRGLWAIDGKLVR